MHGHKHPQKFTALYTKNILHLLVVFYQTTFTHLKVSKPYVFIFLAPFIISKGSTTFPKDFDILFPFLSTANP